MSDGRTLTGTGNHPIFITGKGFICLDKLSYGDNVVLWRWDESKPSFSMASNSGATQIPGVHAQGITSLQADTTTGVASICFTERCGSFIRGQFLRAITFTTSTKTRRTTRSATLNASLQMTTPPAIPTRLGLIRLDTASTFKRLGRWLLCGTQLRKAWSGIGNICNDSGLTASKLERSSANAVGKQGALAQCKPLNIARVPALPKHDEKAALIIPISLAGSAAQSLEPAVSTSGCTALGDAPRPHIGERAGTRTPEQSLFVARPARSTSLPRTPRTGNTAPGSVLAREGAGSGKVYNLHVEDCHEFFANGILVHNCYAANTWFSGSEKPAEVAMQAKLKAYQKAGMDAFSLNIHQAQMQREMSKPEEPVTIGRRRHGTVTRR
jgi:hypothetical protein